MSELPERQVRTLRRSQDDLDNDLETASLPELPSDLHFDAEGLDGIGSGDPGGSGLGTSGEDPALAFFCADAERLGYKLVSHGGSFYPPHSYYKDFGMIPPRIEEADRRREIVGLDVVGLIDAGAHRV